MPITTCTAADARLAALRAELVALVRNGKIPSISIAVVDSGKTIWEESIGWRDREQKKAATPDTPYLLASLGKSITATAVMRFVDQHLVALDAPVSRYLGENKLTIYEGSADAVTVGRLLDMTAEIPHGGLSFSSAAARARYTRADLVRNRGMVIFAPGSVPMYSNMSVGIAEEVIAGAAKQPYRDFMNERFFPPLGMTQSFVGPSREPAALHYTGDGTLLPPSFDVPESSLSMYASVEDLVRFARLHAGGGDAFVKPETLRLMQTHRSGFEHAPLAYGIGNIALADGTYLLSDGRAGGAQSTLLLFPAAQQAAICLINATGGRCDELAFRIMDALRPGFQHNLEEGIGEYEAWANAPYADRAALKGEWRGEIQNAQTKLPIRLLFQDDGDVHVRVGEQPETLLAVSPQEGYFGGTFIANVPAEEAAGHPHRVELRVRRNADRLSGYVVSDFSNADGSFSLPSYVWLRKAE
ncbi:MAG: beta-lactamase family protein [Acidobacteria bacterium]|nr:beta-lactamase family protein [Acidobacteriota bacterium]